MTSESIAAAAATWNERFSGEDYVFGREPNEYLRAQAALFAPGSRALCVADGEGRNSVWLAHQGLHVEAFDVAQAGVAKARRLADEARVSVAYHVAGCDEWPWAVDAYDLVVAVFVQFADPEMRERLFANIVRALKPGGLLVLQGYTPKQLEYKTGGPSLLELGSASLSSCPLSAAIISGVRRMIHTGLPRHSTVFNPPGGMSARSITCACSMRLRNLSP